MGNRRHGLVRYVVPACVIASAVFALGLWVHSQQRDAGKMASITVAYSPFESTALVWIAQDKGFFKRNGLDITLRKYDSGAGSLDGLCRGEAEITVGVTEFPLVRKALRKEPVRAIGNIDRSEFIYVVARKDRGIAEVSDLRGKRVGTTVGTIAEFHLGRFLNLHGVDMQDITLVDVTAPEEWASAVARGDIDAISTAQPHANASKERLGANGIVWRAQSNQPQYSLAVSTETWINEHPELVRRFLTSLAQAEAWLLRHPDEARGIVQKRLDLDPAYMETVWAQNQFGLSLDQSLIVAMEDEARWMIGNKLTEETRVPDFLDYIHEDGLRKVKPGAVSIIR